MLRTILLVFGGVVTVVAAFLIFNTFSITVAQRIREFGLLRTLGASRRQILSAVIGESLAIAVVGSLAGLVGGVGAAIGLRALFKAIGIDLPSSGVVFEPRTVIVALAGGPRGHRGRLAGARAARHPRDAHGGAAGGRAARGPQARQGAAHRHGDPGRGRPGPAARAACSAAARAAPRPA